MYVCGRQERGGAACCVDSQVGPEGQGMPPPAVDQDRGSPGMAGYLTMYRLRSSFQECNMVTHSTEASCATPFHWEVRSL